MKNIALAILCVGLCFYNSYRLVNGLTLDATASIFAVIAAIAVFIV